MRLTGKRKIFLVFIALSLSASSLSASFDLHFSVAADTESAVFPDSFRSLGRTASEPNTLSMSALLQPPSPPTQSYVQITKTNPPDALLRYPLLYDPNAVDLLYRMTLTAYDANSTGLSGNSIVTLENPEALSSLSGKNLVYLRRYDSSGTFVKSYDLSDSANHTIQWAISEANGKYALLDLLLVDKCLAADLILSDSINLSDFAVLAANWNQSGVLPDVDVFLDEKVDLKDLSVLAELWLCSCSE